MQVRASSVTGRARRAQVVAATIDVVAASGYRAATFARIAERAGLSSTRLISYHFASKAELVTAVVETVLGEIGGEVAAALAGVDPADAPARLAAYVRAVVALHRTHGRSMRALAGIFLDARAEDGTRPYGHDDDQAAVGAVEAILRDGVGRGQFRDLDPFVVGSMVQRSVDGLAFLLTTRPDLDLDHYADELVTAVHRATRPD